MFIKFAVCSNFEDTETHFGLPHPYSVPTVGETFRAMFYWDTYFTNLANLSMGNVEQAKYNAQNFAALIDRFGYIPNGNKPSLCDRSQPPFFCLMVRDIFEHTGDTEWLAKMYPAICREYEFWQTNRNTSRSLAHYGTAVPADREEKYARAYCKRIGIDYTPEKQKMLAENFLAQAESGWDFNARFCFASIDFCAVDLNSLLWSMEDNLARFATVLQNGESAHWQALADERAARMRDFLKAPDGAFYDRNAVTGEFSPYFSAASLFPLFVGMANTEEAAATVAQLPRILFAHGVIPCEVIEGGLSYQWGAPNGWPCLQVVAVAGLERCGYRDEARRIAKLYTSMVEDVFEKTGALWEKYNLQTGSSDALNEYEMPEMLGWTASAYLYFKDHFVN